MTTITMSDTSEYVSKDILEKDFLSVFSYFNIAQRLLGSCRVDARDCFVSPPTICQKLYTIICCIFIPFLSNMFAYFYVARFNNSPHVGFVLQVSVASYSLVFLCNMIHVRFLNNEENVKFYIKMQEIDRSLVIGVHKDLYKFLRFVYNASIVFLGAAICILVLMFLNLGLLLLGFIGMMCMYATFTLETVYCINLSVYFIFRLRFINSIIANYIEPEVRTINMRKKTIRKLAAQTHNFRTSDVDIHLKALFECFEQFQNLYRFQVLLFLIGYIISVIFCVKFLTTGVPIGAITLREGVVNSIVVVIGTVHAAVLYLRLEIFFREIKETKRLCIRIMSIYFKGPVRQKAKKTLKMIEESAPGFKIYGILEVNAKTMLKLISFVTFVVVTILQFAFL